MSGTAQGHGLIGDVVDYESLLYMKVEQERPFEKLQLSQRSFLTLPYLGKGSCDPDVESRLLRESSAEGLRSTVPVTRVQVARQGFGPQCWSSVEGVSSKPEYEHWDGVSFWV